GPLVTGALARSSGTVSRQGFAAPSLSNPGSRSSPGRRARCMATIWTRRLRCARLQKKLFPKKLILGRFKMTMLRMLVAAIAAALVLAVAPAQAQLKTQWVEYNHGDTRLKAYMAYDDRGSAKRPAVLMIHAREGMTPRTQGLADIWAKLGYVSF